MNLNICPPPQSTPPGGGQMLRFIKNGPLIRNQRPKNMEISYLWYKSRFGAPPLLLGGRLGHSGKTDKYRICKICRKHTEFSVYGNYRSLYGYNGILAQFKVKMRWNLYFLLGQVLDNVIKWPDAKKSGPATIYSLPTGWKCTQYTEFTGGFWKIPYIYGTFCIYGICRLSLTVGQILFNPLMEMWGYLLNQE